jgi:enoyl-CoA hydratase/carnithine racemase
MLLVEGNILALTQNYRFMAQGKKLIGLNKVKLGVPAQYLADLFLRQIIGHRAARNMIYSGVLMSAKDGKNIGPADEVTAEDDVEAKAIEKISNIAKFPKKGFAAIKQNHTSIVQAMYQTDFVQKNAQFVDCWFSPEVQNLLIQAADKF